MLSLFLSRQFLCERKHSIADLSAPSFLSAFPAQDIETKKQYRKQYSYKNEFHISFCLPFLSTYSF